MGYWPGSVTRTWVMTQNLSDRVIFYGSWPRTYVTRSLKFWVMTHKTKTKTNRTINDEIKLYSYFMGHDPKLKWPGQISSGSWPKIFLGSRPWPGHDPQHYQLISKSLHTNLDTISFWLFVALVSWPISWMFKWVWEKKYKRQQWAFITFVCLFQMYLV